MKKILVGAAWKMNKTVSESIKYVQELLGFVEKTLSDSQYVEVFVLPTYLALYPISKMACNSKLKYGAQNCFWEDEGPYTGEISPMHLKLIGCTYVELGHPERRNILKEDDSMVNRKVIACLRNSLTPILCVGEESKATDISKAFKFLKNQLFKCLKGVSPQDVNKVVIAYEPVWAIGAESSAPVDYIYCMISYLREILAKEYGNEISQNQFVIYGGAVNLESANNILRLGNNDGIFIGRAGLNYEYFTSMIKMAVDVEKERRKN